MTVWCSMGVVDLVERMMQWISVTKDGGNLWEDVDPMYAVLYPTSTNDKPNSSGKLSYLMFSCRNVQRKTAKDIWGMYRGRLLNSASCNALLSINVSVLNFRHVSHVMWTLSPKRTWPVAVSQGEDDLSEEIVINGFCDDAEVCIRFTASCWNVPVYLKSGPLRIDGVVQSCSVHGLNKKNMGGNEMTMKTACNWFTTQNVDHINSRKKKSNVLAHG